MRQEAVGAAICLPRVTGKPGIYFPGDTFMLLLRSYAMSLVFLDKASKGETPCETVC